MASETNCLLERPREQTILEGLPFEELHDEELPALVLADVVDGADVRVIERGRRPRLAQQSIGRGAILGQRKRQELERHGSSEPKVLGPVDDPHTTPADLVDDPIVGNRRPDHRRTLTTGICVV
jgi:hypothetical protein